jgi:methionyl-tRNA formyltransferase
MISSAANPSSRAPLNPGTMHHRLRVVFMGELRSTFSRLHYKVLCETCDVLLWVAGDRNRSKTRAARAPFSSFTDLRQRIAARAEFEARSLWEFGIVPSRMRVRAPVYLTNKQDETLVARIAALAPDVILSAGYSRILPSQVVEIPRLGAFNCHPSPLPRYAGSNPWFWILRNGETKTAVTIHRMAAEVDAGDILTHQWFAIPARANHQWLYNRSALVSAGLLKGCVKNWAAGDVLETPQDHSARTFFPAPRSEDYSIDWSRPASEVWNLVRAAQPAPGAWTLVKGQRVVVQEAESNGLTGAQPGTVLNASQSGIVVACGSASICIRRLRLGQRDIGPGEISRLLKLRRSEVIGGSKTASQLTMREEATG